MDHYGQTAVHLPSALLKSALLVALPLAGPYGEPGLATAIGVASGLTTPSLEAGLRVLWPSVLPDARLRHAALALYTSTGTGTQGPVHRRPATRRCPRLRVQPHRRTRRHRALGLASTVVLCSLPVAALATDTVNRSPLWCR